MEFFKLKINKITTETPDAVTLEFEVPEDLKTNFQYKHGQYLAVKLDLDGHEIRRSYSMSSSPHENRLAVTVKKVVDGKASTFLTEKTKVGDLLEVAPPAGRFTIKTDPEKRRTYYMFAAGSGITPIISIAREVLESEPMSTIFLLFGNRIEENIIFRDELDKISVRYQGQMNVEHILSQPKKESAGGGIFGLFKKTTTNWRGKKGRIDGAAVRDFLDENMIQGTEHDAQYFTCGPGNMAETVKSTLLGRGIPEKQIHTEYFLNANHAPGETAGDVGAAGSGMKTIVHLKGERIEISVAAGQTILDALVKEKYDPPYSCTAGACATCMAKVISGKVKMDACYALDDDEVKAGYVLTCQSHPDSAGLELTYDM